jgi:hypothetical protein
MNRRSVGSIVVCLSGLALCAVIASCSNEPIYRNSSVKPKTKDLSFGRPQIDPMLADRPDMAGILSDDDPMLLWIIESMNGGRIGQRIY